MLGDEFDCISPRMFPDPFQWTLVLKCFNRLSLIIQTLATSH